MPNKNPGGNSPWGIHQWNHPKPGPSVIHQFQNATEGKYKVHAISDQHGSWRDQVAGQLKMLGYQSEILGVFSFNTFSPATFLSCWGHCVGSGKSFVHHRKWVISETKSHGFLQNRAVAESDTVKLNPQSQASRALLSPEKCWEGVTPENIHFSPRSEPNLPREMALSENIPISHGISCVSSLKLHFLLGVYPIFRHLPRLRRSCRSGRFSTGAVSTSVSGNGCRWRRWRWWSCWCWWWLECIHPTNCHFCGVHSEYHDYYQKVDMPLLMIVIMQEFSRGFCNTSSMLRDRRLKRRLQSE